MAPNLICMHASQFAVSSHVLRQASNVTLGDWGLRVETVIQGDFKAKYGVKIIKIETRTPKSILRG